MIRRLKAPLFVLSLGLLLSGCGKVAEEALQADTAEESASDALDKGNFPLATQCINQLKANGAKLNVDQFMVVSEAGVNIQNALIEAAENGDKNAQRLLNMQGAARHN